MAGKIPPPPPPCLASLFRQGGEAENPLFPWLCQVETMPRPSSSPSEPTLLIPNSTAAVWGVWGQPGGPNPPAQPCWSRAAQGCELMLWHCWSGRLPMELLLPNPTTAPICTLLPHPQSSEPRAASHLSIAPT